MAAPPKTPRSIIATKNSNGDRILNGLNLEVTVGLTGRRIRNTFGNIEHAIQLWEDNFGSIDYNEDGDGQEASVQNPNVDDSDSSNSGTVLDRIAEAGRNVAEVIEAAEEAGQPLPQLDSYKDYMDLAAQYVVTVPANSGTVTEPEQEESAPPPSSYGEAQQEQQNEINNTQSILNDPIYGSIVRGWNQKLSANNVRLSSLVPFAELYAIFPSDDNLFNLDVNRFTGIKNRVADVTFIDPNNGQGKLPLPPGINKNSKVAKIGSVASQLEVDYITEYGSNLVSSKFERTYKGPPGITDVAISRASSGAYNIKYDINITMPNPEILNDQYEYSKLLLLRSNFLLIHGWNIANSDFESDHGYPPKIDPKNTQSVDVPLYSGNNGFWSASIITLYSFDFEFDNVGHLVGKLRFLTNQGAFMSAINTDQIASSVLDSLNEASELMLNRVSGSNEEEKQKAIFQSGIPWSKLDQSDDDNILNNAALEASLKTFYNQLNDGNLRGAIDVEVGAGGGVITEELNGLFNELSQQQSNLTADEQRARFTRVSQKVRNGVQRAADACRDIWTTWVKNTDVSTREIKDIRGELITRKAQHFAHSLVPSGKTVSDYEPETLDPKYIQISDPADFQDLKDDADFLRFWITGGKANALAFLRSRALNNNLRYDASAFEDEGGWVTDGDNLSNAGTKKLITYFSEKASFGSQKMRDDSEPPDITDNEADNKNYSWDAFLDSPGNQDLRNYYYNNILMDVVKNDTENDLAFIPPSGYGFNNDGRLVKLQGPGETQATDAAMLTALKNMPKGMLMDKNLVPATEPSYQPPGPASMPAFGSNLQRRIFERFSEEGNPNKENFSDTSVLDQEVFDTIKRTSILSIPSLVTAPKNPTVPVLPTSPDEAIENGDVLFKIIMAKKLRTANQTGDDVNVIYKIQFATGGFQKKENIFTFVNVGNAEGETGLNVVRTGDELKKGTEIIVTSKDENGNDINVTESTEGNLRVGAGQFFVNRIMYILTSGYFLNVERLNPSQVLEIHKETTPKPLFRDSGLFIPELGSVKNNDNIPEDIRLLVNDLIDATGDRLRISQIAKRKDLGTVANVNATISNVDYNVIMRPSYYFLGSVLEAMSLSLNENVKFFYRQLPSRQTIGKNITIPIPESQKSSVLTDLDNQIFNINKNLVDLGASNDQLIGDVKRSDFIDPETQTPEQEALVLKNYIDNVVRWHNGFSTYMRDKIIASLSMSLELSEENVDLRGDIEGGSQVGQQFNLINPDSRGAVALGGRNFAFQQGSGPSITELQGGTNQGGRLQQLLKQKVTERFSLVNNQAAYNNDNGIGVNSYFFILTTPINDPQNKGMSFGTGLYEYRKITGSIPYTNYAGQYLTTSESFPDINNILKVPVTPRQEDLPLIQRQIALGESLLKQKTELGFDSAFKSLDIKTTFEIPVSIAAVDQMLRQEGGAPSHSLLKKLIAAASDIVPQLRLSMRPFSTDSSYIDVFVNAVNVDGVITEVSNEIDAVDLQVTGEGVASVDQFRRSLKREGSYGYTKSEKVMVCNFGTGDSLVENFQMSSKIDGNAFANFRVPTVMGGASLDISSVLNANPGILDDSGILTDIASILEDGPVGGIEDLKELQIINEVVNQSTGKTETKVSQGKLRQLLTNTSSPIIQKTAQTFIEDLMSQNVKLSTKIMALQSEYFEGLTPQTSATQGIGDKDAARTGRAQRLQGSRFYGNILNTYLRTVTLTVHGTTNLNVFNYIYLKGLLSGVEGLYVINSINESVTPTSFTTTIECKLVEYTQNDIRINPLAYRGEGSIRRFAEISRGLRLPTGNGGDATVSVDFNDIAARAKQADDQDNN